MQTQFVTCPHPSHGLPFWAARRFSMEACDQHPHSSKEAARAWRDYYDDFLMRNHDKNLPQMVKLELVSFPSIPQPSNW